VSIRSFEVLIAVFFCSLFFALFSPAHVVAFSLWIALGAVALMTADDILDFIFASLFEMLAILVFAGKKPFSKLADNQKVQISFQ